ncbi:MAG: ScyD/ScyE family protein [Xanthomonadales bacterium]|nr:ScyD/ScyE family protein [Xanthomonadales bacterium]
MTRNARLLLFTAAFAALSLPCSANAQFKLADGLAGAQGSTVGPDGALYATERLAGRISRIDPWTGDVTTFAEGLPVPAIDIGAGGATDVAFIDGVAYALVTVVGPGLDIICVIFGGSPGCAGTDAVGIYRIDGPAEVSLVADLGTFSRDNPPGTAFFLDHGVQYAMDAFRGGLLVTDGHHNRVLWVSLDGEVSVFKAFGNIVPTGLEVHGRTVFVAEAGPIPHVPADGKVVAIDAHSGAVTEVGSGAPLLVDVEYGLGRRLYALAQGEWCPPGETPPTCGKMDGAPAEPNGGSLVEVNADGGFSEIVGDLNLPTSLEFIGNSAYIVNLLGEIWVIEDVSPPPFGLSE